MTSHHSAIKWRVFWVNIAISKLNLLYRYCLKLIGELRKEKEFRQQCCRNSTKIRREKDKKVEREKRGISTTLLPKFLCPNSAHPVQRKKQLQQKKILVIVAMALPKMRKKIEWNYGNVIAENGRKKKKFVAEIWEEILKKMLRSQYFYNTFTTNHR